MSGGFFRGTSAEQDTRFSNKQAKLLKTQKFAPELEHLVDITKVKMDVLKPWIAKRATELLGFEDELLINFIYGLLEGKAINGKQVQIQLTGFMEKHTGKFMKELWALLISAQNNASGIPQQFLDAKEEETRKKKEESDRVLSEIQKKKEKEDRDFEQEKAKIMDGGAVNNIASERKSFGAHSEDEKDIDARNGFRAKNRYSKSPHSDDQSISPQRQRKRSKSLSGSPPTRRRSVSSERIPHSPRRSVTPRGKRALGSRSPVRKPSHSRRGSISRSRHRSPSLIRRRVRSPLYRGTPSPSRRISRSPIRRKSPSRLQHRSRSPLRRRSPFVRRRHSPSLRHRHSPSSRRPYSPSLRRPYSPSPRRRYSPSPRRRYSPSPRRRSPSPRRRYSPSPRRRHSPYPRRHRSPSLRRRRSPSPRRRSPSPRRRRSPPIHRRITRSPSTSKSPSPTQRRARRRSLSLVVRRSISPVRQRSRSQMSSSLSPIRSRSISPREHGSLSPAGRRAASVDQRSSASPVRQGSLSPAQHKSRSPLGVTSPLHLRRRSFTRQGRSPLLGSSRSQSPDTRRSPSPLGRKITNFPRSPARHREKTRKHDKEAELAIEGEKSQYSVGRQPISLSPQRDEKSRNNLPKKVASSPSLKKSSTYSESPVQPRSPREDRSVSPTYGLREHNARNGSPRVMVQSGESKLVRESEDNKYKLSRKTSVKSSAEIQRDPPDRSGTHGLYDTADFEMRDKGVIRNDTNGSKVDKGKVYLKDDRDGNMLSKSETLLKSKNNDGRKIPNVDYSGSEESDKPRVGGAEKRRRRRSSRREAATDRSSDDSEVEEKRESKKRRKEEKKLRKEERRQRREERRRRKEEKRASRRKRKSKDSDSLSSESKKHHDANDSVREMVARCEGYSSEDEETESEKKRVEIELRERALQSLREKKGISR